MRVITFKALRAFWESDDRGWTKKQRLQIQSQLTEWYVLTNRARWATPSDVKGTFGSRVDFVQVRSGNTVAVFDAANNLVRVVVAIHYDYPRVFVLRVLTHEEYDSNLWKEEL
jgi:mRNA interferase HigB